MKKFRYLGAVIIIFTVLFSSCKKKEVQPNTDEITQETNVEEADMEEEEEPTPVIYYLVKLEENTLFLYEVDGENYKQVTSLQINAENYPIEDISALKSGIEVYFKEDGYALLENFAN